MKTLKQVEELTGIKSDNLRQLIARKSIKAIKLGRDWFIKEKEVNRLLKKKKSVSTDNHSVMPRAIWREK